jgi:Icc-related predicted phosphoesterase
MNKKMKICYISDTHGEHRRLTIPECDMIIFAGDMSKGGTKPEIEDFFDWFSSLDILYKVAICGNHDMWFNPECDRSKSRGINQDGVDPRSIVPENVIYLQHEHITIEGIKIFGSPYSPEFHNWAFNLKRGKESAEKWDEIDVDSDIVIIHGPANGVLDMTYQYIYAGCEELIKTLEIIRPKIFCSGHIHEAYGILESEHTTFINASMVNGHDYTDRLNDPIVLDYLLN